jgi:hypothetical protein
MVPAGDTGLQAGKCASVQRHYDTIRIKFPPLWFRETDSRSTELETNLLSRKPILIWLIISQVLALASSVVWLLMAGLSVMAFDSGVTQEAWNFVIAVWLYPVWPIAFAIASWSAYWRKRDKLAGVLTLFTFLPILVLLVIIIGANFFVSLSL